MTTLIETSAKSIADSVDAKVQKRVVELLSAAISDEAVDAIANKVAAKAGTRVLRAARKKIEARAFSGIESDDSSSDDEAVEPVAKAPRAKAAATDKVEDTEIDMYRPVILQNMADDGTSYSIDDLKLKHEALGRDVIKAVIGDARGKGFVGTTGAGRGTRYFKKQMTIALDNVDAPSHAAQSADLALVTVL